MPPASLRAISTIFLDRDGTINVKPAEGEYVTSPAGLVLLPGAARRGGQGQRGRTAHRPGDQSALAVRAAGDPARYAAVHARLEELLAAEGAWLDAAYHCPHAAAACDCRKPGPGMLQRAAREYPIELDKAVIIGDSDSDLMAGRAAGTATILLRPGAASPAAHADAVADDLRGAVRLILQAQNAAG